MEKLLQLINEYENRGIELEEGETIGDVRTEFNGHLRFNNTNMVQFPDDMFDYYAISKGYGFIKRLVKHDKINFGDNPRKHIASAVKEPYLVYLQYLNCSDNPISDLISLM